MSDSLLRLTEELGSDDERERKADLFYAIMKGRSEAVQELLRAGVKVGIIDRNNKDNTPLHSAVEKVNKRLVEILLLEWRADINAENNKGDTPLHIAVTKCNEDLITFLLNNGAKVNIKNKYEKTPLDSATGSTCPNKKEIIKILEDHLQSISESSAIRSTQEKEIREKFDRFVVDFVSIYEMKISNYIDRLEKSVAKPGKWADFVNEIFKTGGCGTEHKEVEDVKVLTDLGIKIVQKATSSFGSKHNREELKKLIKQLYVFKDDPDKFRKVLVKSGVEIFLNFESQFVQVTADGSWQRAMIKLAEDAVNRVFDYHRSNIDEAFSTSSVSKGVVLGRSKTYKHTSTGIPHLNPGHTLKVGNLGTWNTAQLFTEVGLIRMHEDGTKEYYKKRYGKSNTREYGYRLHFEWEPVNEDYEKEMPTKEEYKYVLMQSEKSDLVNNILDKIKNQNRNLMEERLIEIIQEGMQEVQQWGEKFNKFIEENFERISSYIQNNRNEIIEIFNSVTRQVQELALSVEQGKKENFKGFEDASKQREKAADCNIKLHQETHQALRDIEKKITPQKGVPRKVQKILFDVRSLVSSFAGREEKLVEIFDRIKQGTVVITGLGGVGKSELAINFAHEYYKENNFVIWINAENHKTAKDSFRKLMKELKLKTKDEDNDEKSVGLMAKEVYDYFTDKECLFIFDNAEEYSIIKEFLPLSTSGYRVLITSQNHQLFNDQEHGKIEMLKLKGLSEDKAVDFLKKALEIDDHQDEQIKELVKTYNLGDLPLALQHTVAYIKESGYVHNIGECVKIYRESKQEIEVFLNQEGLTSNGKTIFLTFKTTIDKVKKKENGNLAEEILNTMAYFAPDNIPKKTFLKLAQSKVEESDVKAANGKLARTIKLLEKYSIISFKEDKLSIHRLVQEVIRLELMKQNVERKILEQVLGEALELLRAYTKDAGNVVNCIPHIISVWDYASKSDELIKKYITDSDNNKATTSKTYFHLISEGSNYQVINAIVNSLKISPDNLKEVINAKSTDDHTTPLHKAVLRNDCKIAKLLIDEGADVNAKKNYNDWTTLHMAAKIGNLKIVNALLEKKANVDDKSGTKYQFTPLHLASRNGHRKIVEVLLRNHANINAYTKYGFTPLHLAADNGCIDVVKCLLNDEHNIIINAKTKEKQTSLHLAAKRGHLNIVEALLAKSANVNAQNQDGFTALHFAALYGHAEIVDKLLQDDNIDIYITTTKHKKPLDFAIEKGHSKIHEALIAKGNAITRRNTDIKSRTASNPTNVL